MWLYHFKSEHILGISAEKKPIQDENKERPQNEPIKSNSCAIVPMDKSLLEED